MINRFLPIGVIRRERPSAENGTCQNWDVWLFMLFKGGFVLPQELNSCSTDLRAQIGGVEGRCLQVGDQLQR